MFKPCDKIMPDIINTKTIKDTNEIDRRQDTMDDIHEQLIKSFLLCPLKKITNREEIIKKN